MDETDSQVIRSRSTQQRYRNGSPGIAVDTGAVVDPSLDPSLGVRTVLLQLEVKVGLDARLSKLMEIYFIPIYNFRIKNFFDEILKNKYFSLIDIF